MTGLFLKAKKLIEDSNNLLLAGHKEPDGDSLGSMLALSLALNKINKKNKLFCPSKIPASFHFLPHVEKIKNSFDLKKTDLIIGLDYGSFDRLGLGGYEILSKLKILTFDHHQKGDHLGLQIIKEDFSSTAEIIYFFLDYLNIEIDAQIATCLLAGILYDTGGFRHPNTSSQTLQIAGKLLGHGGALQKIIKSETYSPSTLKLWYGIFEGLKIDANSGVAHAFISYERLSQTKEELTLSKIANLLNDAPEAKLVLLLTEKEPGKIDGNLRCRQGANINVAKIARSFGGGGHRLAAGFQSFESPAIIIEKVKRLVIEKSV
jgi:phosphoesterase RecJ-like protein